MKDDKRIPENEQGSERRTFLKQVAGVAGGAPFVSSVVGVGAALAAKPSAAQQPAPAAAPFSGYLSLSADEGAFVEAMVNVMCPADDFTPNGVDCGLAIYIDRQLAGDFGKAVKRYMRGPWQEGKPQMGYQLPLTPEQFFKAGVEAAQGACKAKHGKPFDQVAAADADAFLRELAGGKVSDPRVSLAGWFNGLVYPLFTQACFADPIYGGNYGKVFWKMIGYPGLPATNTINMVQYRGKPFPGASDPKSIADFS
jgi:gluconate 2-dehydrogenase gamma chain